MKVLLKTFGCTCAYCASTALVELDVALGVRMDFLMNKKLKDRDCFQIGVEFSYVR